MARSSYYLTCHYISSGTEKEGDTARYGDEIDFYTTNHNYQLVSPSSSVEWKEETYYLKDGTSYTGPLDETAFNTAKTKNKNFYIKDHTVDVKCPVCDGYKKLFYRTGETSSSTTSSYTCPRCNGKGPLIKATNVKILGISVFYQNSYDKRKVQYQVIPPGAISSVLIPEKDVIKNHSAS